MQASGQLFSKRDQVWKAKVNEKLLIGEKKTEFLSTFLC